MTFTQGAKKYLMSDSVEAYHSRNTSEEETQLFFLLPIYKRQWKCEY